MLLSYKQKTVCSSEWCNSTTCQVVSGVPRGLVLGPLLFLIYINDSIKRTHTNGNTINFFADDMELVQKGIDNVCDWVKDNNLCLNSSKCKFMTVSKFRSRGIQNPKLMLYNNLFEQVAEYKYLGVTITIVVSTHQLNLKQGS